MIETKIYKDRLETEKLELERQLETIARPNLESPGNWEAVQKDTEPEPDLHDQADLLDQYQENRALTDVLNLRYRDVEAALARIDNASSGICEISSEPIETERLETDPAARTCKTHIS